MKSIMIVDDMGWSQYSQTNIPAKFLVSSALRSLFEGEIIVFRQSMIPLYKVERARVREETVNIRIEQMAPDTEHLMAGLGKREFRKQIGAFISAEDRQWIIFVDSPTLLSRNIDHLFPEYVDRDGIGNSDADLLWSPCRTDGDRMTRRASTGFWAVRGKHLKSFLSTWERVHKRMNHSFSEAEIFAKAIDASGISHRQFEKGEVININPRSMNWNEMKNAAVLSATDFDHADQVQFLQSMYFGFYYGDERGVLINMMEG